MAAFEKPSYRRFVCLVADLHHVRNRGVGLCDALQVRHRSNRELDSGVHVQRGGDTRIYHLRVVGHSRDVCRDVDPDDRWRIREITFAFSGRVVFGKSARREHDLPRGEQCFRGDFKIAKPILRISSEWC